LEPIWSLVEETGASRLALILPGRMTRLPVEAFLDGSGAVAMDGRSATYLPSVRFGADLVGRSTRTGGYPGDEQRVLAIGYGGDDMPEHRAELDDLAGIWGKRLHIVAGDKCTKASVIEVLRQPWDIVHVAAHGTFDEVTPLRSALHFRADRDDDAHRVTAEDLLRDIQRPGHPLVILSACSSVVTADSKSNSFHGLAGSLFRIGAQAIIGSRWPVGDLAARRCMTELHRGLAEGMDADLALSRAGTRMRDDGLPAEEWAAFGYFGVA
jgi:CHAT domain-containing protein